VFVVNICDGAEQYPEDLDYSTYSKSRETQELIESNEKDGCQQFKKKKKKSVNKIKIIYSLP
jgi:hypothetical protein